MAAEGKTFSISIGAEMVLDTWSGTDGGSAVRTRFAPASREEVVGMEFKPDAILVIVVP